MHYQRGNFHDEVLRKTLEDQKDDVRRYVILIDGEEYLAGEIERKVVWVQNPQFPDVFEPKTISIHKTVLGDDGKPLDYKTSGACTKKCIVASSRLFTCKHCKRLVCVRHAIFLPGKKVYCKEGWCLVTAIVYRTYITIFRIIRFCYRSIFGLEAKVDSRSEEDIFISSEEYDLIKKEIEE
jgi:hypothetical protein